MFFLTVTIDRPLQGHTDLHRRRGRTGHKRTAFWRPDVPQDSRAICCYGTGKEKKRRKLIEMDSPTRIEARQSLRILPT